MLKKYNSMNNNFTEDNIKKIKTWKEYIDKGHYGDSRDIVNTYNVIFNNIKKPQAYTTCGSCLRRCCLEMYNELQKYEEEKLKALETLDSLLTPTEEEIQNTMVTEPENTMVTEQKKKKKPKKNP